MGNNLCHEGTGRGPKGGREWEYGNDIKYNETKSMMKTSQSIPLLCMLTQLN